jgi:YD repeat-containing protein
MTKFKNDSSKDLATTYSYDDKDRKVETVLPDGATQTSWFKIENGKLLSYTRDPNGNVSLQETDSRGNIVLVERQDNVGTALTKVRYEYNDMGEMLLASSVPLAETDEHGKTINEHPVTVEYDLLGRRKVLESADSGKQEFGYDGSSNLIWETNSVLREKQKQIKYEYDGLNRLVTIDYPEVESVDTVYTYGDSTGNGVGAAGKILSVTDASGTISYEYGELGEVTKETRSIETHLGSRGESVESVMEYCSDYLGRMQWIIYPDGETITYGYDAGGQVTSVKGSHWGKDFNYVNKILYDEHGQRTRIEYGNGTSTDYEYDEARRWLATIKTDNGNEQLQNISYSFDKVGNVRRYENDCLDTVWGKYKTSQKYEYDSLYQLTRAEGYTEYNPAHSQSPEFTSKYTQLFSFDSAGFGNMILKDSAEKTSTIKPIGDDLNYTFDYEYDSEKYAHRLLRAGDRHYKYDANGNIVEEKEGAFDEAGGEKYHKINEEADDVYSTDYGWGLFREKESVKNSERYHRTYTWNEKNQLVSTSDAQYTVNYVYGQDGQRAAKYTAQSETLYFNKMWTLHTDAHAQKAQS